jgi:hypothetical protein
METQVIFSLGFFVYSGISLPLKLIEQNTSPIINESACANAC